MYKHIRVKLNERVVVFKNGLPLRALDPGRHLVWGFKLTEQRWNTDTLVFAALPEVRAVLPDQWYREVAVGPHERGVLFRDGKPQRFFRPGVHRFWTIDPSVELLMLSIDEPMPELTDELIGLIPGREYVNVTVAEHERGLQYVQGRLDQVLEPGRYAIWSHPEARVEVRAVDMRRQQVQLAGQELMTRDKVTLRLTLTAEYGVVDPSLATHTVADVRDAVYLLVQLAARDGR